MERPSGRFNVTLDPEPAALLEQLSQRTHVQPGTLAKALLTSAIEDASPDARNIVVLLDGIPGAHEHAMENLAAARGGDTIPLDEL
jgi:hypothetical protein